ncbi:MAG: ABC transporter substrate-binding protein [Armatimonadetes bacterium]|nr:ABC transporter substrate-binding protein [Armatimonadota bacterium]
MSLSAALSLAWAGTGCKSKVAGDGSKTADGTPGGVAAGDGLELAFWHTQTQENKEALEALAKKFNETNGKGIVVKPIYQGNYPQLYQKLMTAISGGKMPEIAVSYESMVVEYMRAGAVVPLDDYVNGPNGLSKEDQSDIFPAFLETNRYPTFNNQLLSFPFTKSLLVNYVNLDALKRKGIAKVPETWQEFEAAATALTGPQQGGLPPMKGLAVDVNPSTIDGWIMSHGGTLLDETGANFASPASLAVFQTMNRMFEKGAAYQTRDYDYQADFGAQRAGMVCTSSTQRTLFRPMINDKFDWKLVMIPQTDPKNPVTVLYGANVCIFKTTKEKQDAAWEFLKWLTEKDQAAYWAIHSSYMPLRQSVAQLPEMQKAWQQDPQGKQAFEMIKFAKPEPNVRGWQEVRDEIAEAMTAVINNTKTPEQAAKDLDAAADKLIQAKK